MSSQGNILSSRYINKDIFRAYDIRGLVDPDLSDENVAAIGFAIGTEALDKNTHATVIVGRDGRLSSPQVAAALQRGLCASGCDVIDIGLVPTPVLYFATHVLGTGHGVIVTGSHNPPAYNGFKMVINHVTLSGETIHAIRQRLDSQLTREHKKPGSLRSMDIVPKYIETLCAEISEDGQQSMKIVIDCGNGAAGMLAPHVFRQLGHEVIELFCEVDGCFPNHHPDPSVEENLRDLIQTVSAEKADLGLAFDGDGDRLGVVDDQGHIIWPDRQLMLMATDVLAKHPGAPIIFDVKCSQHLATVIEQHGGQALMWKTGHSLIKQKMQATNAPLAGEFSGHIFFADRWYGFDDAIYAGARLLEIILSRSEQSSAQIFAELPEGISTPEIRVDLAESMHAKTMQALKAQANTINAVKKIDIDGLRLVFEDGWGLVRQSNTSPYLVLRFEADNPSALNMVQAIFRDLLAAVDADLVIPF